MRAPGVRAVELAREAEEKAQDVLDEWLAPLKSEVDRLMELAEAGSDDVFLSELEGLLAKADASDESLTNSDALIESLWGLQADAFREGWEWYDRDDVAGAKDDCRAKDPNKCRFHGNQDKDDDSPARLLSVDEGKKRMRRRYVLRDKQKRRVIFGNKLRHHFERGDKNRVNRLVDLALAEETVMTGKAIGSYRRHYGKVFKDSSEKRFGIIVAVVKNSSGQDEVINYMRVTPAEKLWNSVKNNDRK